jgi:C1A family cysteine protease
MASERPRRRGQKQRAARPISAETQQAKIQESGHDWRAGATALSALSVAEQRSHLGLIIDPAELAATAKAIKAAEALQAFRASPLALPTAVDWRNFNGANWLTPIRDQQSCGSCVSFGTCATIEARIKIVCKNAALTPDLSEAQLFYCGCGNCCGTGWYFSNALDFARNTGIARESDFPYTPGNQACTPNLSAYIKLTSWTQILSVADRKNLLATKGPLVAGMIVYQDFFAYQSGVYRHTSGTQAGGHAISMVGYDDTAQCWICKNSWGTAWGEAGFFRIGYGECGMDTSFASYDIDLNCPAVPPADVCEQYLLPLKRVLIATRTNQHLRDCLRYYVCHRGVPPWWAPSDCRVLAQQIVRILLHCPKYRESFCRALG